MLDDQAELVDGYLAGRQRLAEGGDDRGGGLLAGAVAQGHVGTQDGPGVLVTPGLLVTSKVAAWAASKIGARTLAVDMGSTMPSGL